MQKEKKEEEKFREIFRTVQKYGVEGSGSFNGSFLFSGEKRVGGGKEEEGGF